MVRAVESNSDNCSVVVDNDESGVKTERLEINHWEKENPKDHLILMANVDIGSFANLSESLDKSIALAETSDKSIDDSPTLLNVYNILCRRSLHKIFSDEKKSTKKFCVLSMKTNDKFGDKLSLRSGSLKQIILFGISFSEVWFSKAVVVNRSSRRNLSVMRTFRDRCNFFPSFLIYNSKVKTFISSFLDSCSSFDYIYHATSDCFLIRLITCYLIISLLSLRTLIHIMANVYDVMNILKSTSAVKSIPCEIHLSNDACNSEGEIQHSSFNEKVVELRVQPIASGSKHFYGDVDLQTQNYENESMQLPSCIEEDITSKENQVQDDELDPLKRIIRKHTTLPDEKRKRNTDLVVAPASGQKRRRKRRSRQSNENQNGSFTHSESHERKPSSNGNQGASSSVLENQFPSTQLTNDLTEVDEGPPVNNNALSQVQIDGALSIKASKPISSQNTELKEDTRDGKACENKYVAEGIENIEVNTTLPDEKRKRNTDLVLASATKPKNRKNRRSRQSNGNQNGSFTHSESHERISSSNDSQEELSSVLETQCPSTHLTNDSTEVDKGPSVNHNALSQVQIDGALSIYASKPIPSQKTDVKDDTRYGKACEDKFVAEGIKNVEGAKGCSSNLLENVDMKITVGHASIQRRAHKEMRSQKELPKSISTKNETRQSLNRFEKQNSPVVTATVDSNSTSTSPSAGVEDSNIQRNKPLMNIIDEIARGERVPPHVSMQYEMLRFSTLRSFPKENKPYITKIAAAGFYYANSEDEVVCYACARRKRNWDENDDPLEVHRQLNPNCKFLLRNSEVNIPIKASLLSNDSGSSQRIATDQVSPSTDASSNVVTNTDCSNALQSLSSNNGSTHINAQTQQVGAQGNFVGTRTNSGLPSDSDRHYSTNNSVVQQKGSPSTVVSGSRSNDAASPNSTLPKYPNYANKPARMATYSDCGNIALTPEILATCGFFYAGFGDCVRCFQCGIGLRHWSAEDDPWIEHSRWSKDCLYVKQMRGQEFVHLVQMAVEYSHNQNANGENRTHNSESHNGGANGYSIEHLMHTDSAQSVLEMGYDPAIIRRAICAIKDANSQQTLSAANLMEKIFEIEESDSTSNAEQNRVSSRQDYETTQSMRNSNSTDNAVIRRESVTDVRETRRNNQTSGNHSSIMTSTERSEEEGISMPTKLNGSLQSRTTKNSALSEQKRLQEENMQLKQQSVCSKCKLNDVCIVFLPCGHLVTCETCAPTVRYCTVQDCGKYIKGTVRTYLA